MTRGIGIYELVTDAKTMPAAEFEDKHGAAFLIRTNDDGSLKPLPPGKGLRATTEMLNVAELAKQSARLENPEASYVYPVRPRPHLRTVSIGRLERCDITIEDVSVSKQHAQLAVGDGGAVTISDLGSKNGTRVGDAQVAPKESVSVQFGKTITIGAVRLTFLPVRQLIDFITATFEDMDRLDTVNDLEEDFDVHVEFDDG